jgi:hypothetical protein
MSDGEKITRKGREEREPVKTEERKSTRGPRPKGMSVLNDRTAIPDAIRNAYPDCEFFWENDEKGKVQMRESQGWEVVRGSYMDGKWQPGGVEALGSVVSQPVGSGETTHSMNAVLMVIPREWYEELLDEQKAHNQQVENSLRRGSTHGEVSPDGTYAPRLPNGKIGYHRELVSR